jgi:hypothetical protein
MRRDTDRLISNSASGVFNGRATMPKRNMPERPRSRVQQGGINLAPVSCRSIAVGDSVTKVALRLTYIWLAVAPRGRGAAHDAAGQAGS